MGEWRHKPRSKNDKTSDPTESAFFSNEAVGNISTAVSREGNQNVLDEVKDSVKKLNGPARATITLSGNKYAVPAKESKKILSGLIPHLMAKKNGIMPSDLPDFEQPMPFLLFEDFNTNGLEGDPGEYSFDQTNNPDNPHNFYYFWRAYGKSGKLANKMGSWGVGKSVFPASSKINCFWAVTIRESDKQALLIGQSVLKTHNRLDLPAECGYFPWGDYGVFDKDGFVMPETSLGEIQEFQKMFKLRRTIADDKTERELNTGLSIIIPFPRSELTLELLTYSTIKQFFYPILLNKLEVEIRSEDSVFILNGSSLKGVVQKLDFSQIPQCENGEKEKLLSLFEFGKWMIGVHEKDLIKLNFEKPQKAYEWRKSELFKDVDLKVLQNDFDKGKALAFLIPLKFQQENGTPEFRYFQAFIQKDENLLEPESIFIRDSLTITGVRSLKRKGVRGIVLISDKDLVTFFGQAEGPAHTGWHKDNFRVKYESSEEIISFVQRSLERLYTFLQRPPEGLDKELLRNLFSIDSQENELPMPGGKKEGKKDPKENEISIPHRSPKRYQITQLILENGFKITNNPGSEDIPDEIKVKLAYLRQDSNPFKKYSVFDFDVKDLNLTYTNVDITKSERNRIEFNPSDKDFELIIKGFDNKRDLIIDVN